MEKLQTFDSLVSKNDFVIKFANVNGSGSASANQMFAKAVFRMGIPVSPKNIFPSNIQGLPTWFEIRINKNPPKSLKIARNHIWSVVNVDEC